MKRAFLLMVVPALLVALGFAQTPAASVNTEQTNIKGCLGGSDGNYTVVEDKTGNLFKITSSSVDLKSHLGHDVTVIGHKANETSFAAYNNFAVTELNMISEHCAAAAAAPAATVTTPTETAGAPAAAAVAPAGTVIAPVETAITPSAAGTAPAATVTTPAAPAAPVTPPAETASAPAAAANTPAATVTIPEEPSAPAAAAHATRSPARPRRVAATPAAAATAPAVSASTASDTDIAPAAAGTTVPAVTPSTSSETDSTPAAAATTPTAPAKGGSLWLLILFAVLVIVIGTLTPLLSRWRKRKMLERTGAPNLSFTNEASSDQSKSDPPARKAA